MKSIVPILLILLGMIGCDTETPSEFPENGSASSNILQQTEISGLERRLETELKTNAEVESEFEKKKAEIEARISEVLKKREELIKLQADHYAALAKEESEEVERLKTSITDMETWDPIPLGRFSKMREIIEELSIENQNLKDQLDAAKTEKP